jgi:hypothetical protein
MIASGFIKLRVALEGRQSLRSPFSVYQLDHFLFEFAVHNLCALSGTARVIQVLLTREEGRYS